MKILISGFEPFGGREINISQEVTKLFTEMDNLKVKFLPVSFEKAPKELKKELSSALYDLIIMLGETSSSLDYIRLERVAINLKDSSSPDNDGNIAEEEYIFENEQNAFFTTIPIRQLFKKLNLEGYHVRISNTAGTYVCNCLYYQILKYISDNNLLTKALFIHLPASTEIVSLEEMRETIENVISNIEKI